MDTAQHIVKLGDGTLTAELVDRTMLELSLKNPAFAPVVRCRHWRAGCGAAGRILGPRQGGAAASWTGWSS